jgi:hypothetical protein
MTACACSAEEWPARTLLPRPAAMASRLRASASGSRWAGVWPTAWARPQLGGDRVDDGVGVLDQGGATASAESVSASAK